MKKCYPIIYIVFLFSCTFTKQQKAERVIKEYLKTNLNDPSSYEPVSFDSIKIIPTKYETDNPEGKRLDTLTAAYMDSSSKYSVPSPDVMEWPEYKNRKPNARLEKFYKLKEDSIDLLIKLKRKNYIPRPYSYEIAHTYRAKNGFGALGLHTSTFIIDSTMTKVLNDSENN